MQNNLSPSPTTAVILRLIPLLKRAIMTSGRQGEIGGPGVVPVPGGCGYRDPDDKRIDRLWARTATLAQMPDDTGSGGLRQAGSGLGLRPDFVSRHLPDKPIASARLCLTFCGLPAPGSEPRRCRVVHRGGCLQRGPGRAGCFRLCGATDDRFQPPSPPAGEGPAGGEGWATGSALGAAAPFERSSPPALRA